MSTHIPEIRLAMSYDFLDAFASIPQQQQSGVRQFLERFRRNPAAPTHNFEVIRHARDGNLRSVRIDGT
jgi:hypothetical protein